MDLQDIFIHGNTYEEKNGIIHLNLSDSKQSGGNLNDNIIHLSLTSTNNNLYQNGGATDSSDYFNKLAEKIVNSKITQQDGGFNVITTVDESSEIFLSSETINDIKNTTMSGGGKKNKLNFNFNDLKKHLLKVSEEFSGGSDNEDDDIFEDDEDDEDDAEENEIRELFNDTDEENEIANFSKKNKISMESHRSKTKRQTKDDDETDDNDDTCS